MCEEILKSGFFASIKNSSPVKVYVFSAVFIQEIFFKNISNSLLWKNAFFKTFSQEAQL